MIEEFFETEKELIDKELERYFTDLNKKETDVILKDFISQVEEFIFLKSLI